MSEPTKEEVERAAARAVGAAEGHGGGRGDDPNVSLPAEPPLTTGITPQWRRDAFAGDPSSLPAPSTGTTEIEQLTAERDKAREDANREYQKAEGWYAANARAESLNTRYRGEVKAKLAEMGGNEKTFDPYDEGYVDAVNELAGFFEALAPDAGTEER